MWASHVHAVSVTSTTATRPDAMGDRGSVCYVGENSEILPSTLGITASGLERLQHSYKSNSGEEEAMIRDADTSVPDKDVSSRVMVVVDLDEDPSSSEYSSWY